MAHAVEPERWDGGVVTLATRRVGRPLLHYECVPSTMPLAHDLARAGAGDGTALVAEEQSAGRGRRGRRWHAPYGTALLCSLVLRPPSPPPPGQLFALMAAVSVGIRAGVEEVTGLRPLVKWPNDLLLGGRKVGGVLCEARFRGAAFGYAVAGFGLNVNLRPEDLPPAGDTGALAATSLAIERGGRPVDRRRLLVAVLAGIDAAYELVWSGQDARLHARWRSCLAGLGEAIRIETETGAVEGIFTDVDDDGALRLTTARGEERILVGEVVLGPRATL